MSSFSKFGGITSVLILVLIISLWGMMWQCINLFHSTNQTEKSSTNQTEKSEEWVDDGSPHSSNQTHPSSFFLEQYALTLPRSPFSTLNSNSCLIVCWDSANLNSCMLGTWDIYWHTAYIHWKIFFVISYLWRKKGTMYIYRKKREGNGVWNPQLSVKP